MRAPAKPIAVSHRLLRRQAVVIAAIGALVSLAIGLAALLQAKPVARLDDAFLDRLLAWSASHRPPQDAVVIDIDDVSLSAIGQWPWPRYRMAALIERVAAAKPLAIGLDVLLPESDRSSLVNIRETFKRDFDVDVAFSGVPDGLMDNDGYLGETMGRVGVVGANYFYFDHVNKAAATANTGFRFGGRRELLSLPTAAGVLSNARAIASQTRWSGFLNNQLDDDGVLRRMPLLILHGGAIQPSLALATTMRALGTTEGSIESDGDGPVVRIAGHRVPVDEHGYATLRFHGKSSAYASIPAIDILNGDFDPADLAGRIVFVGSSAVGLNDVHNTALDPRFPGLKVQAVMAGSIVHDDFVRTPSWSAAAAFASCVAIGVAMSVLFVATSGVAAAVGGSAALAGLAVSASGLAHAHDGRFVSPAAPLAVVATLFVLFFVTRFAFERKRARLWQRQLENARQVTIESMASVAETRDPETGAHIKRTQHYVQAIAEQMKRSGVHADLLTRDYIHLLFLSAPLHDIGKVGVPDHILLKPGKLTHDEMELMKQHAEFGRRIIHSTAERIDGDNFLVIAGEIAASHHEKWDGSGYPAGLAGEAIPLSGRIMAVADIYDALISRRCYKEPFPHAVATTLMREARGTTFDPAVLDAFFAIEATIRQIADRYGDESDAIVEQPAPSHELTDARLDERWATEMQAG